MGEEWKKNRERRRKQRGDRGETEGLKKNWGYSGDTLEGKAD